jgi:hypothetical protein
VSKPANNTREPNELSASAVEGFAQLDAFDEELSILEARSAARQQQLKECEESLPVSYPRGTSCTTVSQRQCRSLATLQADIEADLRKLVRSKEAKARPDKGKSSKAPKRQVRESLAWIGRLWACCEHSPSGSSSAPSSLWIHWKTIGVLAALMVEQGVVGVEIAFN